MKHSNFIMPKQELVTISKEEYESMKETIEILSDKSLMLGIFKGIDDIKKGKFVAFKDFKKKHQLS